LTRFLSQQSQQQNDFDILTMPKKKSNARSSFKQPLKTPPWMAQALAAPSVSTFAIELK